MGTAEPLLGERALPPKLDLCAKPTLTSLPWASKAAKAAECCEPTELFTPKACLVDTTPLALSLRMASCRTEPVAARSSASLALRRAARAFETVLETLAGGDGRLALAGESLPLRSSARTALARDVGGATSCGCACTLACSARIASACCDDPTMSAVARSWPLKHASLGASAWRCCHLCSADGEEVLVAGDVASASNMAETRLEETLPAASAARATADPGVGVSHEVVSVALRQ
mmetsp:Transcript_4686/g.15354  ORF Transcript_4686/g.15354 Transcript_4686/m.15354 type:complete len:234 (-) Transcript_4686:503-1204(-)